MGERAVLRGGMEAQIDSEAGFGENSVATAPLLPLVAAAAAQAASLTLLILGSRWIDLVPRHVAGWVLSSLFGFTLVVAQRRMADRLRYERPLFQTRGFENELATGLLWAGFVLTGLHAWRLATHYSS